MIISGKNRNASQWRAPTSTRSRSGGRRLQEAAAERVRRQHVDRNLGQTKEKRRQKSQANETGESKNKFDFGDSKIGKRRTFRTTRWSTRPRPCFRRSKVERFFDSRNLSLRERSDVQVPVLLEAVARLGEDRTASQGGTLGSLSRGRETLRARIQIFDQRSGP